MILVRGRGCLAQKTQTSKTPTRPFFNRSNDRDYTDPLESNKPRALETLVGLETSVELVAPAGLF